ncbi:MAG: hypothetical protein ABI904_23760 [Chloroflexota bacterium]
MSKSWQDTGLSYIVPVWHCYGKYHTILRNAEALALIPRALQKSLRDASPSGTLPSIPQPVSAINDLERQRKRVQQAYEADLYTLEEAQEKIKAIDTQIHEHKNGAVQRQRRELAHKQFIETLEKTRAIIDHLPQWIASDDPLKVNTLLTRLCEKIVITPAGEIIIHLRG